MKLSRDFAELITAFESAGVDYLVVGGFAYMYYVEPRATKDLDLWLRGTPENLDRAGRALVAFGAPPPIARDLRSAADDDVVWLGQPPGRVDFLRAIDGAEFDSCYARRVECQWQGVNMRFIALDDLIANKRAVGRTQDLADLDKLERVRARKR